MPTFRRCRMLESRSCGLRICDHATGHVGDCAMLRNRLAALCVSQCARAELRANTFDANGLDG
eukprot:4821287-Prymnesium_polylepis.1